VEGGDLREGAGANVAFTLNKKSDLFIMLWTISVTKLLLKYYQDGYLLFL